MVYYTSTISHHGINGQKWGIRRWQNLDGSLTEAGRRHYGYGPIGLIRRGLDQRKYEKEVKRQVRVLKGERSAAAGNNSTTDTMKVAAAAVGAIAARRLLKDGLGKNGEKKVGALTGLAITAVGLKFVSDYIGAKKQEAADREKYYEDVARADLSGDDKYTSDRSIQVRSAAANQTNPGKSTPNNTVANTGSKFMDGFKSGIGDGANKLGNAVAVGAIMMAGKAVADRFLGEEKSSSILRLGGAKMFDADAAIRNKANKDKDGDGDNKDKNSNSNSNSNSDNKGSSKDSDQNESNKTNTKESSDPVKEARAYEKTSEKEAAAYERKKEQETRAAIIRQNADARSNERKLLADQKATEAAEKAAEKAAKKLENTQISIAANSRNEAARSDYEKDRNSYYYSYY